MLQITRRKSIKQMEAEYKKEQLEKAKLVKQLQIMSKDDYDFIAWALHYTLTEIENKRQVSEQERDQFNRLMYQTTINGKNPKSAGIYHLNAEDVINEVKGLMELEEELEY